MSTSLYDFTVAPYLQILAAVVGYLDKGRAHCEENDIDLADVVETKLYPDMLPFRFQIYSVAHHSLGAIRGVQSGSFSPPPRLDLDYDALQKLVIDARAELEPLTPEEVNALEGGDVVFNLGEHRLPFVAEDFLMTFSLPNFYFHATTAYDMLRMKGVPLGKRDFIGRMNMSGKPTRKE